MNRGCIALLLLAGVAQSQDGERVSVPLTDPSKPVTVKASLLHSSVVVRSHAGREVVVQSRELSDRRRNDREAEAQGLRRIPLRGAGITVEEVGNVVQISSMGHSTGDVAVQVPQGATVVIKTVQGSITAENIDGELDLNSTNGRVMVTNASGAVVAHALNGSVVVSMDRVASGKPMSFSTLNGNIDVTFPADLKANVKLKADNGDMFTDFDITTRPAPAPEGERSGGRYRVRFDRAMYGTINGGGPEMSFTTLNGKIYIRRKK